MGANERGEWRRATDAVEDTATARRGPLDRMSKGARCERFENEWRGLISQARSSRSAIAPNNHYKPVTQVGQEGASMAAKGLT